MVSLKDGFTVWRLSQKEDFLSIYINVLLSMMSGRGANPIFFDKKRLDVQNTRQSSTPYVR